MTELCSYLDCTGCGVCVNVCPKHCIQMETNSEGFAYPAINEDLCIQCGKCQQVCPSMKQPDVHGESDFYMAWHKDKEVLSDSSSGGIFTALADLVLSKNGVVVGAALDELTREVSHIAIENRGSLGRLRRSKYYQSRTGDIYDQVREWIKQKRYVLFSGTSCQVAALYTMLGGMCDSEYLLTVDVLCHGVTSKTVIDSYIKSKEKKYMRTVKRYYFRIKDEPIGWRGGTRMKLEFTDGSVFVADKPVDTFFVGFSNNLFLRESCYRCKYCGTKRVADFTIADFWGISETRVTKEQFRDGVSLMLVNSEKARKMLNDLQKDLLIEKVRPEEAIPYNRALEQPNERPKERDKIYSLLETHDYDHLIRRLCWREICEIRVKRSIKKLLGEKTVAWLKKLLRRGPK